MNDWRNRLDAEWAAGLDYFGISRVTYPRGLLLPDGQGYLPEFFLPKQHAYMHVITRDPQMSFYDIWTYAEAHPDAMIVLAETGGKFSILGFGQKESTISRCRKCGKYFFVPKSIHSCIYCGGAIDYRLFGNGVTDV